MRTLSVYQMRHGIKRTRTLPREGSLVRLVYDFLKHNAGQPVSLSGLSNNPKSHNFQAVTQLRDFYGCDIVRVDARCRGLWMLKGEWIGDEYVDYQQRRKDHEQDR